MGLEHDSDVSVTVVYGTEDGDQLHDPDVMATFTVHCWEQLMSSTTCGCLWCYGYDCVSVLPIDMSAAWVTCRLPG